MLEICEDNKSVIIIYIGLDFRDEDDHGKHGRWIHWSSERLMDRKGGPLWEQGWEGTRKYQPGQRGHKILTSKALSIVWVTLPSRAAPLALEGEVMFFSEPAHITRV